MTSINFDDDEYASLDHTYSSLTDPIHDPQTFDQYIEFIKLGSQIKVALVKKTERDTAAYLMSVLRAVITEQRKLGLVDKEESNYVLDAVFDQALRRGWVD